MGAIDTTDFVKYAKQEEDMPVNGKIAEEETVLGDFDTNNEETPD